MRAASFISSSSLAEMECSTNDARDALQSTARESASAASTTLLKEQLRKVQLLLLQISQAQEALLEQASNTKYQIRKMEVGSIDHFHKGLTDRIGEWPPCRCASFLTAVCCRVTQSGF